jgi:hypothetical protein
MREKFSNLDCPAEFLVEFSLQASFGCLTFFQASAGELPFTAIVEKENDFFVDEEDAFDRDRPQSFFGHEEAITALRTVVGFQVLHTLGDDAFEF